MHPPSPVHHGCSHFLDYRSCCQVRVVRGEGTPVPHRICMVDPIYLTKPESPGGGGTSHPPRAPECSRSHPQSPAWHCLLRGCILLHSVVVVVVVSSVVVVVVVSLWVVVFLNDTAPCLRIIPMRLQVSSLVLVSTISMGGINIKRCSTFKHVLFRQQRW